MAFQERGAAVEHSPGGGGDPRFATWYHTGLPAAAARCTAFVIVRQTWWDSSTWMAIEAEAGAARALADPGFGFYVWQPESGGTAAPIPVGLREYVSHATVLPEGVAAAVDMVLAGPRAG